MSEATIKAGIVSTLQEINGVGVVHSYVRRTRSLAKFLELMRSGNVVNGWTVCRKSTSSEWSAMSTVQRIYNFEITGMYQLDDENASEINFQALLDAIFDKFITDCTIGGTCLNSDPINIADVGDNDFGTETSYHTALLHLTCYEDITY